MVKFFAAFFSILPCLAFAQVISQLPPASTPLAGSEAVPIVQGGVTKRASISDFFTGDGAVTAVSGTANRITSTGGTAPVIDISAAYIGQASITTLGTISTGVWNGTAISLSSYASGTLQAAQEPAHTGDMTNSAGSLATTVAKINGVALGTTTATAGNLLIGSGTQWVTNAVSGDAALSSAGALSISSIGGKAVSLSNSLTTSGNFAQTFTFTGITNVTFPTSGTLLAGNQTITLSGDTTGSGATAITTTTAKVNGVSYGTSPSTNTVPVVTGTNAITYEAVPNAALANSSLTVGSTNIALGATASSLAGLIGVTATTFTGALTGNASTATALATARAIGGVNFDGTAAIVPQTIQTVNEAADTTCFPLFVSASGTQSLQPLNNTAFTFNASTGALGATSFSGAGTGLTGTAASLTAGTASAVAVGGITGLGTGVATALAVNVGSAGAFVTFNGAGGTPSSMTATNLSGTAASLNIGGSAATATSATTAGTLTGALSANQVLGSLTAVAPTGQSVPSCSTASSALQWTSGTGFGCNTSITAAAVPASGITGTTLASGVVTTSITSTGALTPSGNLTMSTHDIVTDTTTGTKFGTGSTQKIGFEGATPVVQQTGDVGTAAVTFGLMSGTPTFGAANLTGTIAAARMPALTGDITTSAGAVATTVAAIAGTTVSGTTGTTNVMFSASPTTTGTLTAAAISASSTVSATTYAVTGSTAPAYGMYKFDSTHVGVSVNSLPTFLFEQTASSVNYLKVFPQSTGNEPAMQTTGSDSNIAMGFGTQGTAGYDFKSNGGTEYFAINSVANAVDWLRVTPAATANPATVTIDTVSSDSNVNITITAKGTGTVQMPVLVASSAAKTGSLCWTTGSGAITVDTTLACLSSLEELKNIQIGGIPTALEIVEKLKPFWFSWKKDTAQYAGDKYEQAGLGAHQVEGVDKRLVGYSPDGKLQGVRYSQLVPVLVAALQTQQTEIEGLKYLNDSNPCSHLSAFGRWLVGCH